HQGRQDERRLDLLAAEAAAVIDHKHVERRAWSQARQQPHESRTARELRTAHTVIDELVLRAQRPALAAHEAGHVIALELDGLLGSGHVLTRALAEVRGGDHDRPRLPASTAWRSSHSAAASRASSAL